MRKSVCLTVSGISIVVAAVSLGVTLTRYVGLRAYSPKGTALAAATAAVDNVRDTPPEQWNNLFAPRDGMKMASRLPAVNAKTGSQAPHAAFLLVGTIVSPTPSARRAILWAAGMKLPKAFREKEEVEPGAILASVERDKVWITRGKEREKLEILPVGSLARPTSTGTPTVAVPVASPGVAPRPGAVGSPSPPPDRTRALPAPQTSSGAPEDDESSPRERRKRAKGLRR